MSINTAINATLQARDWEFLFGVVRNISDAELQACLTVLRNYYNGLPTKPSGNDNIVVATTEGVIVKLFEAFLRTPTTTTQTNNLQPYTRIRAGIIALNNTADNYILNSVNTLEAIGQDYYGSVRKTGRKNIMMKEYDNN